MSYEALLVGDVHLSDRAPSSRTSSYTEDILDKLQFCVELANEHGVPLIQAGDLFHVKAPSKNSHRLVQRTHDVLSQVDKDVWIVPGNHDLSGDRLDSLDSQPLGALCRMDKMHLLIGEDYRLPGIAGVPYISEFDGGSWQYALDNKYNNFDIEAETPTLIVTHAPIFPPGQAPGVYASIEPDDWCEYWIGIIATYYGHIHDCHGTFMSPNQCMEFCNQGALSRGSLHEATVNRKPAVTLWSGSEFTRVEVPHKKPEEVFLFDQAIEKAVNKASAEDFASALGQVRLESLTLEAVYASLRGEVSDKNVLKIIESLLEEVQ